MFICLKIINRPQDIITELMKGRKKKKKKKAGEREKKGGNCPPGASAGIRGWVMAKAGGFLPGNPGCCVVTWTPLGTTPLWKPRPWKKALLMGKSAGGVGFQGPQASHSWVSHHSRMAALSHSPPKYHTSPSAQGRRVRMPWVPTKECCGSLICIPVLTTGSPLSTVWPGWGFAFLLLSHRNSTLQNKRWLLCL